MDFIPVSNPGTSLVPSSSTSTQTLFQQLSASVSDSTPHLTLEQKQEMTRTINSLIPIPLPYPHPSTVSEIVSTEKIDARNDMMNRIHNTLFSLIRRYFLHTASSASNTMFSIPYNGTSKEKDITFQIDLLPPKLQSILYLFCKKYVPDPL